MQEGKKVSNNLNKNDSREQKKKGKFKMENNLPKVKKENIFIKIRNWFVNIFKKPEITYHEELIEDINKNIEEMKKTTFKDNLKVESKDKILALQRKLKEKQMEISELTNKELDEMIELYKVQIEEKKQKLKQYRNKIFKK